MVRNKKISFFLHVGRESAKFVWLRVAERSLFGAMVDTQVQDLLVQLLACECGQKRLLLMQLLLFMYYSPVLFSFPFPFPYIHTY